MSEPAGPVRDTAAMIAGMDPTLAAGRFVFVSVPEAERALVAEAQALFREAEGISLVLPVEAAERAGLPTTLPMRQITLQVHSALDGIGLTAAVSACLTDRGIPCNVIAAAHHDHVFVPEGQAETALDALRALADGCTEGAARGA